MEFDYYDISPLISQRTDVFPGDKSFKRNIELSFADNNHIELSSIQTTLHIGAHADAPNHYHSEGEAIHERPLFYYYGKAQVIHLSIEPGELITKNHLGKTPITAPRVLFFTNSFPDPENWNSNFCAFSAGFIDELAQYSVRLIGIDTPSIDPENSKTLDAHKAVYKNNMAILEGLVLTEVPEGIYHLVALPLKLENCDASPVRAILIKNKVPG